MSIRRIGAADIHRAGMHSNALEVAGTNSYYDGTPGRFCCRRTMNASPCAASQNFYPIFMRKA